MSELKAQTKSEATALAKEMGLEAIFAEPNELLLDYDQPFEVASIKVQASYSCTPHYCVLTGKGGIRIDSQLWTVSKSGNAHLYLKLDKHYSHEERVAMQCILGSDLAREAFNILRYRVSKDSQDAYCIALFETPIGVEQVRNWRNMYMAKIAANYVADMII